jgi:hypothetical protein
MYLTAAGITNKPNSKHLKTNCMSIVTQGILGGFSGKTGPVVGSTWKGRSIMRAKPVFKKNRSFTQPQMDQQEKFKMMMAFLRGIDYLLNLTYKTSNRERTGFQEAFSANLRDAVAGLESPYSIDYSKVKISNGTIPVLSQVTFTADASNMAKFGWNATVDSGNKASTADRAIAVLYSPEDNLFLTSHFNARRSDQEVLVDAALFTGKTVHGWLFFLSDDESKASHSQYAGTITVTP